MTDVHGAIDDASLDQLFREARSTWHYVDEPVTVADRDAIWSLMKMGPTSANCLPARLVWCDSDDAKARLAACCSEGNRDKVLGAPVTVVIGMDMEFYEQLPDLFPHADARSWFVGNPANIDATALRNSSLQGAYLILAARALGFACGPMSGFDNAAVDDAFFAGTTIRSNFITTVGRGTLERVHPRLPRPAFDRFNTVA